MGPPLLCVPDAVAPARQQQGLLPMAVAVTASVAAHQLQGSLCNCPNHIQGLCHTCWAAHNNIQDPLNDLSCCGTLLGQSQHVFFVIKRLICKLGSYYAACVLHYVTCTSMAHVQLQKSRSSCMISWPLLA